MTTLEMQQLFESLLQSIHPQFGDTDKLDTDDIFRFLNDAQVDYITKKYLSSPSMIERNAVISNSLQDLNKLVKTIKLGVTLTTQYPNNLLARSNEVHVWQYITVNARVTKTYPRAVSNSFIDFEPIEANAVNRYLTTNIHIPIILVPVFTYNKFPINEAAIPNKNIGISIFHDNYTTIDVDSIHTHCIVRPSKLVLEDPIVGEVVECELAEYLHADVVKWAVEMYIQNKFKLTQKQQEEAK